MAKVNVSDQMVDVFEPTAIDVRIEGNKVWVNDEKVCRFRSVGGRVRVEVDGKFVYACGEPNQGDPELAEKIKRMGQDVRSNPRNVVQEGE